MLFDLPLDQLQTYKPDRSEPADFDAFWAATLADARLAMLMADNPLGVGEWLVKLQSESYALFPFLPPEEIEAVRQSARPGFHFMAFDAPRSFYLPGVGAVIVLSPRPAVVAADIVVELPRPRRLADLDAVVLSRTAAEIRARLGGG